MTLSSTLSSWARSTALGRECRCDHITIDLREAEHLQFVCICFYFYYYYYAKDSLIKVINPDMMDFLMD